MLDIKLLSLETTAIKDRIFDVMDREYVIINFLTYTIIS